MERDFINNKNILVKYALNNGGYHMYIAEK